MFAITMSDSDSSNSDMERECDSERNYRAFMTITSVDSKNDLSKLVDELGDLSVMRKLKNQNMKTCAKMKGQSTYKKHMILC